MDKLWCAIIGARVQVAINIANFPTDVRYTIFGGVAIIVAKLDWLTMIILNGEKKI